MTAQNNEVFIMNSQPDEFDLSVIQDNFEDIQKQVIESFKEHQFTSILNQLVQSQKVSLAPTIDSIFSQDHKIQKLTKQEDFNLWIKETYCFQDIKELQEKQQQLITIRQAHQQLKSTLKDIDFENQTLQQELDLHTDKYNQMKKQFDISIEKLKNRLISLQVTKNNDLLELLTQYRLNQLKSQNFMQTQDLQNAEINSQIERETQLKKQYDNKTENLQIVRDSKIIHEFIDDKDFTLTLLSRALQSQKCSIIRLHQAIKQTQNEQTELTQKIEQLPKCEYGSLEDARKDTQIDLKEEINELKSLRTQFDNVLNKHQKIIIQLDKCLKESAQVENDQHQIQQQLHSTRPHQKNIFSKMNFSVLAVCLILTGMNYFQNK